uniref:Cadherin-related family member 5-like n=1 Tax=Hippocampus comes TaxID=109280 RepID=A0A3Q2XWA5_HIPCM
MDASRNFCFFFLALLLVFLPAAEAQELCSARTTVNVKENNAVGDVVETITVADGVTAFLENSADVPFTLDGNRLVAKGVLDYETSQIHEVTVKCRTETGLEMILIILVLVQNVNDNAPEFPKDTYQIQVKELMPVGTLLEQFPATDLDEDTTLFYRLTSESNYFGLASPENPQLVIQNVLDYDKVPSVEVLLYAQDTPLSGSGGQVSFTATATIQVTVVDVDNRPPWFQPCNKHVVAGAVVCQNTGYTGRVNLNEMQAEPLTLKPGPLHAIDGDVGINEAIVYSFLSGNEDGLFDINPNTGNVTMVKAADVLGTISLTVLAAQTPSSSQFATTSLTVSVQVKSLHIPRFQRPEYQCVVASVGAMATDPTNKDEPLQIIALDDDYASVGGINPHIVYGVIGSEDFSIVNGYLFMTTNLPEGTLSLQVEAVDTSNEENVRAQLSVEVKSGLTTTALPSSTPDSSTSPATTEGGTTDQAESTTNPDASTTNPDASTTNPVASTTNPDASTERKTTQLMESTANTGTSTEGRTTEAPTESTTNSGTSTGDGVSSGVTATSESSTTAFTATESQVTPLVTDGPTSPADPHTEKAPIPPGGFGPGDMAALGATLGVLLFVCAVIIGVLVCRLQRGKADWRKIHEASVFRSSVGQGLGGEKQGVQYTNEAFQHDDDDDDDGGVGSGGPFVTTAKEGPANDSALTSSVRALGTLLDTDNISQTSSDKEKEVKPILTKERRLEEGYKAVWFKEDIDPNAKEEVVIIPDSRADDSEDEDDDAAPAKRSEPSLAELDLDSGLGVRIEDPAEDSEGDDVLDVDL